MERFLHYLCCMKNNDARLVCTLILCALLSACGAPAIDDDLGEEGWDEEAYAPTASLAGRVGLSVIGLLSPHYQCDEVVRAFGEAPIVFGYLERTFGDDRRCLDRLLDHPRFAAVRVHLFNGPCVRNRRCGAYEVLAGETAESLDRKLASGDSALLGKLRAEMERVKAALAPHVRQGKRYAMSGILEHDVKSATGARRVMDMARAVFGPLGFRMVNNPHTGAAEVGQRITERHGDRPSLAAPCIADLDGTEVSRFDEYANRYRHCAMVLGWNNEMNCLADGEPFSDPRSRRRCPTAASLKPFSQVIQAQR
jgi:hypothetical protein